jgi:hypothetical protein
MCRQTSIGQEHVQIHRSSIVTKHTHVELSLCSSRARNATASPFLLVFPSGYQAGTVLRHIRSVCGA